MSAVLAAIGVGANLGDPATTVRAALDALGSLPETRLLQASPLFRTPAWGNTLQPDFINAAALLLTTLTPRGLLADLLALERRFGRDRSTGELWGPRTLDLDLLVYDDAIIDEPGLHVPHPRLRERAFALLPLARIAPGLRVPGHGLVGAMLAMVDARECVEIAPDA
jgi:2-amino-4-hydroxy-6-hydroxymethyldihydropteridine diphosphokinase